MTFAAGQKLFPGRNYFWISLEMKPSASLHTTVSASIAQAKVNGQAIPVKDLSTKGTKQRMAVGVRHAGDDGAAAFQIPGLVTTNKGTLLAVYDVRYNSSVDLQEHIDIGLSRSTDGGQTWPLEHQLLLDEGESWGYSCLTMIDRETIGILYESSVAHMTFQSIPLKEICR